MARGINKVILVGNLGADPEVRYSASGTAIANLRLATSESWTDKQSGERQERTEWHRVTLFGRLAEVAGEYLKKGRQVYIEGSLRTDKYTDKDGIERYATSVVGSELQMLGGNDGSNGQGGGQSGRPRQAGSQGHRAAASAGRSQGSQEPRGSHQEHADASFGDYPADDDIPFRGLPFRSYL